MNSDCEHITDLLPSLALGILDADERQRIATHLAHCDRCRSEVQGYDAVVGRLGLGSPQIAPPAALKQRLLRRIMAPEAPRERQPFAWFSRLLVGWPRLAPIGMMAGLALAVFLGISNFYMWHQVRTSGSGSGLENVSLVYLHPTGAAPGASGTLLMFKEGGWGMLVVQGLPALAPEREYQLWLIQKGQRTSGGLFSVSAQGEAQLEVRSARPLAEFEAFGITIEPRGGSTGPTGKKVLGGHTRRADA